MAPPSRGASDAPADAWSDLPVFEKNLYMEHPAVASRSETDANAFRASKGIVVLDSPSHSGRSILTPAETFEECSFPKYIHEQLLSQNFPAPTPVQSQAWPFVLSGRNVICVAETGSGKTLSYLLPAIVHVNSQSYLRKGDGPIAVVLAPTRELAIQITDTFLKFGSSSHVKCVCVYGGAPRNEQKKILKSEQPPEIVVATPGRLLDFLNDEVVDLSNRCTFLVIDEADRMLDLGFSHQIVEISNAVRPDRQTVLTTATWPCDVRTTAAKLARDAVTLRVDTIAMSTHEQYMHSTTPSRTNHRVAKGVPHLFTVFNTSSGNVSVSKYNRLVEILEVRLSEANNPLVIIFASSKLRVDETTRKLRANGFPALAMHGGKDQHEREWVLREFRDGKSPILLATDVAARGLDVPGVTTVVNMDAPNTVEDYVHRAGRTGRAGNVAGCKAHTFLVSALNGDRKLARELTKLLAANDKEKEVTRELLDMAQDKSLDRGFVKQQNAVAGTLGGGKAF